MGKTGEVVLEKKLPEWACELSPKGSKPTSVGDVKQLKCSGFDFVPVGGSYSLKLDEKDEYALKILSVRNDSQSVKEFDVTSYKPVKGNLKIILKTPDEELFVSVVKELNVQSVIKNPMDPKPYGPPAGAYILPSTTILIGIGISILSVCAVLVLRAVKKMKKLREFKRTISNSKYADPFLDFNIELRDFGRQKKASSLFLSSLDESLKKVFFRVFEEPVSLNEINDLIRRLKGLGMEPHEVRNFYVLEEEYKKFKRVYTEKKGVAFEEKTLFLDQAKKVISKLKAYVEVRN